MYTHQRMRQYQQQSVAGATPDELILKLYDMGILACQKGNRSGVRAVIVELMSNLNHAKGGELAAGLQAVYEFCLHDSAMGPLDTTNELLHGLREAWREGVVKKRAAVAPA